MKSKIVVAVGDMVLSSSGELSPPEEHFARRGAAGQDNAPADRGEDDGERPGLLAVASADLGGGRHTPIKP